MPTKKDDKKKVAKEEKSIAPVENFDRTKAIKRCFDLKKKETELKAIREKIIKDILFSYGDFNGKSKTFNEDGFKVVVTYGENISFVDEEKWEKDRKKVDPSLRPEKIKFSVDKKGFDFIRKHKEEYPEAYAIISENIIITEKKPTVEITKK